MTRPRLLLADDHVLVREGMRSLLEADYEVVGEAGDGRELVGAAIELRPDVIIADIGMPSLNGLEAIGQIQKHTFNRFIRMETKPIPGERCRFCGDDSTPLVKTPCQDQWIFCDMSHLSYRGEVIANSSMKTTAFATSIITRNITEDGRVAWNVGAFSGTRRSTDLLKTG